MTDANSNPTGRLPLETFESGVRTIVSASFAGIKGTARVHANWGRIELTMIEPANVYGIRYRRDRRCTATAMAALSKPDFRYTYDGRATPRALRAAEEFISKTLRDHAIAIANASELAHNCMDLDLRIKELAMNRPKSELAEASSDLYYLHLWEVTPGTALYVEGLTGTIHEAIVLETGQPVATQSSDGGTYISLPGELNGLELPVIKVSIAPSQRASL